MKNNKKMDILKALANPIRMKIIEKLYDGPVCVCKLNEVVDFSQANLSQHLKVLKDSGIVLSEKRGLYQYYSLRDGKIKEVLKLVESMCEN
ncbi:ArsR/SmtB family transcription factor [Clostridium sp. B9]|uniref:ArsR/SmtB family transcription factor n=1 Tax=Clostridium sp. B9 TaxID=3423224 RepID=UPI003D2F0CC9